MLDLLACWLSALAVATGLWACFLAPVLPDPCDGPVGTDTYYECMTGDELDLTPVEEA